MSAPVERRDHPLLLEVFARHWLHDLARAAGRAVGLGEIPDAELDRIAALGVDHLWLMGVWSIGREGGAIARRDPTLRPRFDVALPGWTPNDVVGSPYAIARYTVEPTLGDDRGLAALRSRLATRGIALILDFVANHVARDHHWIVERPGLFMRESDGTIACGRDPHLAPWTDTAQLDYRLPATRAAVVENLRSVAERCDGVRCDMTMLVLDDVFRTTWRHRPPPDAAARGEFWAEAIDAVRSRRRHFLFLAEAYWGLEHRMQMLGFDYTYDKTLYDRLMEGSGSSVQAHLRAGADFQRRCARFLENHDEPRLAERLAPDRRKAALAIVASVPGMRLLHDGQREGRRRPAVIQLAGRADEPSDPSSVALHDRLLAAARRPALRDGSFATLQPRAAGPGADDFVSYRWDHPDGAIVVVVNFGPRRASCRVTLDIAGIGGRTVTLTDLLDGWVFHRDGDELLDPGRGLFVDLPPWGVHFLAVEAGPAGPLAAR